MIKRQIIRIIKVLLIPATLSFIAQETSPNDAKIRVRNEYRKAICEYLPFLIISFSFLNYVSITP